MPPLIHREGLEEAHWQPQKNARPWLATQPGWRPQTWQGRRRARELLVRAMHGAASRADIKRALMAMGSAATVRHERHS